MALHSKQIIRLSAKHSSSERYEKLNERPLRAKGGHSGTPAIRHACRLEDEEAAN
jgi:hypothetical protein